jgi:hypothetical protein
MLTNEELQEMQEIKDNFFNNVTRIEDQINTFKTLLSNCYKKTNSNEFKQNLIQVSKNFDDCFGRGSLFESSIYHYKNNFFKANLNDPDNHSYLFYSKFLNGRELNNDLRTLSNKLERMTISSSIILKNKTSLSKVGFLKAIGKTITRIAKKICLKSHKHKSWLKYETPLKITKEHNILERNNKEALFIAKEKINPLLNTRYTPLMFYWGK